MRHSARGSLSDIFTSGHSPIRPIIRAGISSIPAILSSGVPAVGHPPYDDILQLEEFRRRFFFFCAPASSTPLASGAASSSSSACPFSFPSWFLLAFFAASISIFFFSFVFLLFFLFCIRVSHCIGARGVITNEAYV
jgi:hypothetical protein